MLGVYEECVVSRATVRRLGLVRSLNPIRSFFKLYQELVDHIEMCERRAYYPNMQLYNVVLEEKQICIQYCCTFQPFYLDEIYLTTYKPSVAYKHSFLKLAQCFQQRVTMRHISCIIYRIIIAHHHITSHISFTLCKRYSYLYQTYQ